MKDIIKKESEIHSYIAQVSKRTNLKEGEEGVKFILKQIFSHERLTTKELSRLTQIPLPVVAAIRREFEKLGLIKRERGITLTEDAKKLLEQLGFVNVKNLVCKNCNGKKIVIPQELENLKLKVKEYFKIRPSADVTLDQSKSLPETSIRRVLFMYNSGAIEGKKIIFLGDDDFVSITLGLFFKYILGKNEKFYPDIVVVEIDNRIIQTINKIAMEESLNIKTSLHDLRKGLPQELQGKFDTFCTDPPYTVNGLELFATRGMDALISEKGKQGFISFGHKDPDETLLFQKKLINLGFAISEIIPSFNEYEGAELIGNISQIIRVVTTSYRNIDKNKQFTNIYTASNH